MFRNALIFCLALAALGASSLVTRGAAGLPAAAVAWKRYVPATERKAVLSKATRGTGLSKKFISKVNARVLWVTDEVARALVSDMLDRKQVSESEADWEYFQLRPEKHYLFVLFIKVDKGTPWGPLDKKGFSLYKENDPVNRIVEGEAEEAYFSDKLRDALDPEFDVQNGKHYFAHIPRRNPQGEPILKDLNDEPQAMFSLQDKEIYLKFVLKELVTSVKDL